MHPFDGRHSGEHVNPSVEGGTGSDSGEHANPSVEGGAGSEHANPSVRAAPAQMV